MTNVHGDLADWLRAVDQLQPQSDEGLDAISRLLGLRLRTVGKEAAAGSSRQVPKPQPQSETAPPSPEQPLPPSKPRRRIESALTPRNTSRNPAPPWLAAARYLETTEARNIRPMMPLEPLFPARTSRAILSAALATPSANGPLDLARTIEMLSRAEVIEQVPRLTISTLVRGVQLLIDRGNRCSPSRQIRQCCGQPWYGWWDVIERKCSTSMVLRCGAPGLGRKMNGRSTRRLQRVLR